MTPSQFQLMLSSVVTISFSLGVGVAVGGACCRFLADLLWLFVENSRWAVRLRLRTARFAALIRRQDARGFDARPISQA